MRVLLLTHPELRPDRKTVRSKTEYDVWRALRSLGHVVEILPLQGSIRPLDQSLARFKPEAVFNLLEEFRDEAIFDFHVVSFLESMGIPFTGCNPRGLVISRHKIWSTRIAAGLQIQVPRTELVRGHLAQIERRLGFPTFVKFNREDASLGITNKNVVHNLGQLRSVVRKMKSCMGSEVLAQEFVAGREVSVSLWGNQTPVALPPWELHLPSLDSVATSKVKFESGYRKAKGIRARRYKGAASESMKMMAAKLYGALDMNGYARFDFRVCPRRGPFLIDVNANPNLARDEDFACSARATGWTYLDVIRRILALAVGYSPST